MIQSLSITVPDAQSVAERVIEDIRIANGTQTLTVEEAAPRLGYKGQSGIERLRAQCKAGVVPAFFDGKAYRLHWPTVTKALFEKGIQ